MTTQRHKNTIYRSTNQPEPPIDHYTMTCMRSNNPIKHVVNQPDRTNHKSITIYMIYFNILSITLGQTYSSHVGFSVCTFFSLHLKMCKQLLENLFTICGVNSPYIWVFSCIIQGSTLRAEITCHSRKSTCFPLIHIEKNKKSTCPSKKVTCADVCEPQCRALHIPYVTYLHILSTTHGQICPCHIR